MKSAPMTGNSTPGVPSLSAALGWRLEPTHKKTTKKKVVEKKAPKKKTRRKKKTAEDVRLKATWGVFSQTLKQVASFEYHQKKQALDKCATLSKSGKPPHFVRVVKEPIEEPLEEEEG